MISDPVHSRELARIRARRHYQRHPDACCSRSRRYDAEHAEEVAWTKHLAYVRRKDDLKAKRLGVITRKDAAAELAKWRAAIRR
jgi:hypothetical protein